MKPRAPGARGPAGRLIDTRARHGKSNRLQKAGRVFLATRRALEAELREEAEELETRLGVRLECLHSPHARPRPPVEK